MLEKKRFLVEVLALYNRLYFTNTLIFIKYIITVINILQQSQIVKFI